MIEIKGVEVGGFQLLHSEIRKYGFQILLSGNSWKLLPTGTKEQTYIWETPSYALLHPSSLFHGQRTDTVGCPWSDAWGTPSHGLENAGQPTSTFVPRDHPTCLRLVWKKRLIMRGHTWASRRFLPSLSVVTPEQRWGLCGWRMCQMHAGRCWPAPVSKIT